MCVVETDKYSGFYTKRWPVENAKAVVFLKVKQLNLIHKGDDFRGIFAFYNTSIISTAILDVFQICQALINS